MRGMFEKATKNERNERDIVIKWVGKDRHGIKR